MFLSVKVLLKRIFLIIFSYFYSIKINKIMKGLQKYATKAFYSEKHAVDFKNRLGENSKQSIKKDKLGRFKVRFLIDKTTVKYEL